MGLVSSIESAVIAPDKTRSAGLTWKDLELQGALGARRTRSGMPINEHTALNLSAVFAAVRRLSEDVGKTPLGVYERMERGRRRRRDHQSDRLVSFRPNPEMSALNFFEALQGHLATWGNAYAEKELDNAGRVIRLWPLTPNRVNKERMEDGRLVYWVRVGRSRRRDEVVPLSPERMLHIPGFGFDGHKGYSVIQLARESLGLTAATEAFGAQHFGNSSRVSGVLQTEKKFSDKADRERLRADWERMHTGLDNAQRVAILDQGLTWQQIGIPPEDAQFLETRKFQVNEVARWFLIPPHKLMDLERSTFSNIEHQAIEYVQDTMLSWYTRWEQALSWDLFAPDERGRLYVHFNQNVLLRGDNQSRGQWYREMFSAGVFSVNDIRELEELNPVEGGDERFVPMNMMPLSLAAEPQPEPAPPPVPGSPESEGGDDDEMTPDGRMESREGRTAREWRSIQGRVSLRKRHERLFAREAAAVVRREADGIRSALNRAYGGRQTDRLRELIDELYEDHDEWVAERFLTVLQAYGANVAAQAATEASVPIPEDLDGFMRRYAETLGRRWTGSSANQIRALIQEAEADELEEVIDQRLQDWERARPMQEAQREVVEAGEAVSKLVWAAGGVTALRWLAVGEGCPLCAELDGRTVGVEGAFLREGDELEADEETTPLTRRSNVTHPPLHKGCECVIVPG